MVTACRALEHAGTFLIFLTTKSLKPENSRFFLVGGGGSEIFSHQNRFIGDAISDKLGWYRFRKSKEVGGYMKVRS